MTETIFEIPLENEPQTFNISMGATDYHLELSYNPFSAAWVIDIYDTTGTVLIVGGIPMVTGVNLLEPYGYLGFSVKLVPQTDEDPYAVPTYDNLGTTGHLYMIVTT